ncbi:MAG: type II toxin-antitoxin system ParD family antitoxin [Nitrospirales bacterium]|nr:type II toxin-antitoxin system ParD family antitoxin [Nitrospirales bacterium]
MMMATMNISVPDPMKDWVEAQVENSGQYSSASDYVRDLIRRDQNEQDQIKALQAAITKGIESGVSDKSFKDAIKEARAKIKATKHGV